MSIDIHVLTVGTILFITVILSFYIRFYTVPASEARKIMGKNYFGIIDAERCFGVKTTWWQEIIFSRVKFSKETLNQCKKTHVLVAVFPLSILEIRGKVENNIFYSHEDVWYNKQAFAKEKSEACWQLVRKIPVENSTNKTCSDQQALLSKNEETPKACVMVYTIIGHYLAIGERLFENVYVRCSDLASDGCRVDVGGFVSGGLGVSGRSDGHCNARLGLSSARKFN